MSLDANNTSHETEENILPILTNEFFLTPFTKAILLVKYRSVCYVIGDDGYHSSKFNCVFYLLQYCL